MPQEVQDALPAGVPFPSPLVTPADYAKLVHHQRDAQRRGDPVGWGDTADAEVAKRSGQFEALLDSLNPLEQLVETHLLARVIFEQVHIVAP